MVRLYDTRRLLGDALIKGIAVVCPLLMYFISGLFVEWRAHSNAVFDLSWLGDNKLVKRVIPPTHDLAHAPPTSLAS